MESNPSTPNIDFDDPFDTGVVLKNTPQKPWEIELTPEQRKRALELWNAGETRLKDIIVKALGPEYDARHRKGIAVKQYLASLGANPVPAQTYLKRADVITLTEEQKEYIKAHARLSGPVSLAREIFNQPSLSNLHAETRAVRKYYEELPQEYRLETYEEAADEYSPPKTLKQAVERVNRYVLHGADIDKLTPKDKRNMESLIKYCHVHQFLYSIREIKSAAARELFESSYIRFCHDKPDLTEEEINLYINWCSDIVALSRLQKEIEMLLESRDSALETDGKMPMTIVDAIKECREEIDKNQKRQSNIAASLQGKRADKITKQQKETASLIQLVQLWKDQEKRQQLIALAEARRKQVEKEVDRLSTMDQLRFELYGLSKEEVL